MSGVSRLVSQTGLLKGKILLTRVLRIVGLTLMMVPAALGQAPGNRSYVGQDIFVAAGQEVHNAVCVFCSVQVEGELTGHAIVLFGNLNVSGRMRRGALVVAGNTVVDSQARIGGDAVVLGGNAVYETDDSITGSAYVFGGHLSKTGGHAGWSKHVSVNPVIFYSLGMVVFLVVVLVVSRRVSHETEVD
jgi:hypothetical protein